MPHQVKVLETLKRYNRCVLAMDLGTGKTHTSTEKLDSFDFKHALVVCQKSMVDTWYKHLTSNYPEWNVIDYTRPKAVIPNEKCIILINYDLIFRRPELMRLKDLSVILDECTIISNPTAKRTKAIFKLDIKNLVMLSGTISKGKYENLYTLVRLVGWNISKKDFYSRYIIEREIKIKNAPFPVKIVVGYKNVEEMKFLLRKYGFYFLKTEDVLSLPEQTFVKIEVDSTPSYKRFQKDRIVEVDGQTLIGDTALTRMLYERQLCSAFNKNKLDAFADLLDSTDDRLIVFYNFNAELEKMLSVVGKRPFSIINGSTKDLSAYEDEDDSVTFCQYQAASMGLTLTKANKMIFYSYPLSCEYWMQSQKRIHRISQEKPCFYYILETKNSVEGKIKEALDKGQDFTNKLFENQ